MHHSLMSKGTLLNVYIHCDHKATTNFGAVLVCEMATVQK